MNRFVNYKLKVAISESGKNQSDVAEVVGISPTAFNRKLNGFQQFKENEIERISNFLNKPILDIFFCTKVTKRISTSQ